MKNWYLEKLFKRSVDSPKIPFPVQERDFFIPLRVSPDVRLSTINKTANNLSFVFCVYILNTVFDLVVPCNG